MVLSHLASYVVQLGRGLIHVAVGRHANRLARDAVQRRVAAVPGPQARRGVGTRPNPRPPARATAAARSGAAVADAAPVGGDSVEIRLRRAQDAGEQAREAEERAVEAAQRVQGALRPRAAGRASGAARASRRPSARRTARSSSESPKRRRRRTSSSSASGAPPRPTRARSTQAVRADVDAERRGRAGTTPRPRSSAPRSSSRTPRRSSRRLGGSPTRRPAPPAPRPRRPTATPSSSASEAEQQASEAAGAREGHGADPRAVQGRPPSRPCASIQRETPNGGLESQNKPELVELAASIGIENRTTMTKSELVDAITKASRAPRSTKGAS